jgi:hypothetical protein
LICENRALNKIPGFRKSLKSALSGELLKAAPWVRKSLF